MPQRTIHYAISNLLINTNLINDSYRFTLGSFLPDSNNHCKESHNNTHYAKYYFDNNYFVFDFNEFFNENINNILNDDLYLGYYIHLITDVLYRVFSYNIKNFSKFREQINFKEKLYNDYCLLNPLIIEKYNLKHFIVNYSCVPNTLELPTLYELQDEINSDFECILGRDFNYLSLSFASEFVDWSIDLLLNEIEYIRKTGNCKLNVMDYLWKCNI